MANKYVDLYLLYTIVRRLTTPFDKWKAYELGVIDKDGNFLIRKDDRTYDQRDSLTTMDLMILNLKKLLAKVPGGSSRLGTFAAALFLLREGESFTSDNASDIRFKFDADRYLSEAKILLESEGSAVPANNVGDGKIAPKADKSTVLFKKPKKRKAE